MHDVSGNKLLSRLSQEAIRSLGDELEEFELGFKAELEVPGRALTHVYFPTRGVVSMVAEPEPGDIVEVATIGREGFVGLSVLLNAGTISTETFAQIPGVAFRMKARTFSALMEREPEFRALLMRYTMALIMQISLGVSCNRLHEVDARCARWLLQTHDRVDGDSFPLTHEFLAQMLGVHRPTVSVAAAMLQKAGFISYTRGSITILNRRGLEEAACPCYRFIVNEYERLLGKK